MENFVFGSQITCYMCPSLTFWVQCSIKAILRIWCRLKGLCLKTTVLNTERKYSYYLCQYHYFKVNAWSIMNGVHDKYKGNTFYKYIWG